MEKEKMFNKLNGWKRLGVVWSSVWILGAIFDFFMSFEYYMRMPKEIFLAHYPIVFGIGFYWVVYYSIRWIKEGFAIK